MNNKQKSDFTLLSIILLIGLLLSNCTIGRGALQAEEDETVTAVIGDLTATTGATGRLVVLRTADLAVSGGGTIQQINVAVGDSVTVGESLLVLDTLELERAVLQAEQGLRSEQINLASLQTRPTASALAAAEAAVVSAQIHLDQLLAGPTAAQVETTEANLRAAEANVAAASSSLQAAHSGSPAADIETARLLLQDAQQTFDAAHDLYVRVADCKVLPGETTHTCTLDLSKPGMEAVQAQVSAAQARLDEAQAVFDRLDSGDANVISIAQAHLSAAVAQRDAAQAHLDLLLVGATQADIAAAKANLSQAQASLAALLAGAKAEEIAIAEARVALAEITSRQAQNNLAQAELLAPFAGVITAVYAHQGEQAAGALLTLADLSTMVLRLDVNELDLGQLTLGQQVNVVLESWPDEELAGEVVMIAPENQGQAANAPVRYSVHVQMEETALPLRIGMSGFANLVLSQQQNVLLLPRQAVTTDKETGQSFVNLVQGRAEGETVTEVEVVTGATNGQLVEIVSGLEQGDRVRIFIAPPPSYNLFGEE